MNNPDTEAPSQTPTGETPAAESRPVGAHTVASFTSIDDLGSIVTSFPQKNDRAIKLHSTGEVYTWERGKPVKQASGTDAAVRAFVWAMTGEDRP